MRCSFITSIPRPKGGGSADRISIPCGQCIACLLNKQSSWVVRLLEQQKHSTHSHFITLTYQDESMPMDDSGGGHTLKYDVQCFLKRLRKKVNTKGIKYFITAEYGETTNRPHYHCIIFNLPYDMRTDLDKRKVIKELTKIWGMGRVDVGTVTPASISYVTKYVITKDQFPENKLPTFNLISKGIGKDYLTREIVSYHHKTKKFHYTKLGGTKVPLPKYYVEKIFSSMEKQINAKKVQIQSDEKFQLMSLPEQRSQYSYELHEAMVNRVKANKSLKTKI